MDWWILDTRCWMRSVGGMRNMQMEGVVLGDHIHSFSPFVFGWSLRATGLYLCGDFHMAGPMAVLSRWGGVAWVDSDFQIIFKHFKSASGFGAQVAVE